MYYNRGIIKEKEIADVSLFKKIDDIKQFLAEETAIKTESLVFAYRDKTNDPWRGIQKMSKKDIEKILENGYSKTSFETAWYIDLTN